MPFLQLALPTTREQADILSDELSEIGALAVTLQDAQDQPIYAPGVGETPLWDKILLTALFDEQTDMPQIMQQLQSHFGPEIAHNATIELIADQAWEHTWKDDFKTQCYQNKLWVFPSWDLPDEYPPHSFILHPGMAFGTGKHPTTQLCLTWLADNIDKQSLIIDYGCGSGILAIAALKLGAKKAYAVDIDPQALKATQDNAEINSIGSDQLQIFLPDELPTGQADILIANILASPLIELAPTFAKLLKPGGLLVVSGILAEQVPAVTAAYASWVKFNEAQLSAEWACVSGQSYK
jgi:ribosomal protein L11 methyltransferase